MGDSRTKDGVEEKTLNTNAIHKEMRRIVALSLLILQFVASYSDEANDPIRAGEYVFASVVIRGGGNAWPITFDVVSLSDSMMITDYHDADGFIRQLLSQSIYVPNMSFACPRLYCSLFATTQQIYDSGLLFVSEFNAKFEKYKQSICLSTLSGDEIRLSFVKIIGFFYHDSSGKYLSVDSNGLDLEEYGITCGIVPLSVIRMGSFALGKGLYMITL